MSTTTIPVGTATASRPATTARHSFGGVVRSEVIKLTSLRSTTWIIALTVLFVAGIALVMGLNLDALQNPLPGSETYGSPPPTAMSVVTGGVQFAMITLPILGILVMTNEYASGQVRSTFAATPTRLPVLAAKAIVVTVVSVVTMVVSFVLSCAVAAPSLASHGIPLDIMSSGTWRVMVGSTLWITLLTLLGLGLGTILRRTAGAIGAYVVVVLVLALVMSAIPVDWLQTLAGYLPLNSSAALLVPSDAGLRLSFGPAALVTAAYPVVGLVAGAALLRGKDA